MRRGRHAHGSFEAANCGAYVAAAAAGVDILALAPGDCVQLPTGTSIAAAHVSGVAVLLEPKGTFAPL